MDCTALPIYALAETIPATLRQHGRLVLTAPTGSGKSTQVPKLVLPLLGENERMLVLQPRRLAARMLAERVAAELETPIGTTVGFQTRYEQAVGRDTRILFITEGILTRLLLSSPDLPGIGAIIFDEFHERSLNIDLGLAMSWQCRQQRRPDLQLIVMSATADPDPVCAFLDDAPHVHSDGRLHPVTISYGNGRSSGLFQAAAAALRDVLTMEDSGDVLIFMPGAAEIRQAGDACRQVCGSGFDILPLYGEMPSAEQRRVMEPSPRRKVIIATNIAETSLTIPGVRHVIDSGLCRRASYDAARGLNMLETVPIARDSAEQRAGRAGREAPGSCRRLWSALEHRVKPARTIPEVQRCDLADAVLSLAAYGYPDPLVFPWFEVPPEKGLHLAVHLLTALGLLRPEHGGLTEIGRQAGRFPLHPRLALLLWYGHQQGCWQECVLAAALLSERPVLTASSASHSRMTELRQRNKVGPAAGVQSDFTAIFALLRQAESADFAPAACERLGLHAGAAQAVFRAARHIGALRPRTGGGAAASTDEVFLQTLLRAFPDRLARKLDAYSLDCECAGRRRAVLAQASLTRQEAYVIAGEVREVAGSIGTPGTRLELSLVSGCREEWLWEFFSDRFLEEDEVYWDERRQQVLRRQTLSCLGVILEEKLRNDPEPLAASALLARQLEANNMPLLGWDAACAEWIARVRWLAGHFPEQGLPVYTDGEIETIRQALCQGETAYRNVRNTNCLPFVRGLLRPTQIVYVEQMAPSTLPLPRGRRLRLEYTPGQTPRGRARIQELFDFAGPAAVAGGRIPILLDILAPNMRTVQITDDLARFWVVHYPALRSALSRRYPKHEWR